MLVPVFCRATRHEARASNALLSLTGANDVTPYSEEVRIEGGCPVSSNESRRSRAAASLRERLSQPAPTVWLSGQEAAAYVGVSWPTLRQAIIEHSIPHVRFGTRWQIELAVLDEHLRRLAEDRAGSR
jgi:excisionase family DNA binding protein